MPISTLNLIVNKLSRDLQRQTPKSPCLILVKLMFWMVEVQILVLNVEFKTMRMRLWLTILTVWWLIQFQTCPLMSKKNLISPVIFWKDTLIREIENHMLSNTNAQTVQRLLTIRISWRDTKALEKEGMNVLHKDRNRQWRKLIKWKSDHVDFKGVRLRLNLKYAGDRWIQNYDIDIMNISFKI